MAEYLDDQSDTHLVVGSVETINGMTSPELAAAKAASRAAEAYIHIARGDVTVLRQQMLDMGDDNTITPVEKIQLRSTWNLIISEKPIIIDTADKVGLIDPDDATVTAYELAYQELQDFIQPMLKDLTTSWTVDGAAFDTAITTYYSARNSLYNKIEETRIEAGSGGEVSYDDLVDGFTYEDPLIPGQFKGTVIPTNVTLIANAAYKSIILSWDDQANLTNLEYYEVQVSDDESDWYSLEFDGTDWKKTLNGETIWLGNLLVHANIPLKGTSEEPIGSTLHYRVRRKTILDARSNWTVSESNATETTLAVSLGDIAANSIYASNVVANFLEAAFASLTDFLLVGDAGGFIGKGYVGDTPPVGAQRVRMDKNELTIEFFSKGEWVTTLKLGGDENGGFFPNAQLRAVAKTGAVDELLALPWGYKAPDGALIYGFEGNTDDQNGGENWDQEVNVETSSDAAARGDSGLKASSGDGGTLIDTVVTDLEIDDDFSSALFFDVDDFIIGTAEVSDLTCPAGSALSGTSFNLYKPVTTRGLQDLTITGSPASGARIGLFGGFAHSLRFKIDGGTEQSYSITPLAPTSPTVALVERYQTGVYSAGNAYTFMPVRIHTALGDKYYIHFHSTGGYPNDPALTYPEAFAGYTKIDIAVDKAPPDTYVQTVVNALQSKGLSDKWVFTRNSESLIVTHQHAGACPAMSDTLHQPLTFGLHLSTLTSGASSTHYDSWAEIAALFNTAITGSVAYTPGTMRFTSPTAGDGSSMRAKEGFGPFPFLKHSGATIGAYPDGEDNNGASEAVSVSFGSGGDIEILTDVSGFTKEQVAAEVTTAVSSHDSFTASNEGSGVVRASSVIKGPLTDYVDVDSGITFAKVSDGATGESRDFIDINSDGGYSPVNSLGDNTYAKYWDELFNVGDNKVVVMVGEAANIRYRYGTLNESTKAITWEAAYYSVPMVEDRETKNVYQLGENLFLAVAPWRSVPTIDEYTFVIFTLDPENPGTYTLGTAFTTGFPEVPQGTGHFKASYGIRAGLGVSVIDDGVFTLTLSWRTEDETEYASLLVWMAWSGYTISVSGYEELTRDPGYQNDNLKSIGLKDGKIVYRTWVRDIVVGDYNSATRAITNMTTTEDPTISITSVDNATVNWHSMVNKDRFILEGEGYPTGQNGLVSYIMLPVKITSSNGLVFGPDVRLTTAYLDGSFGNEPLVSNKVLDTNLITSFVGLLQSNTPSHRLAQYIGHRISLVGDPTLTEVFDHTRYSGTTASGTTLVPIPILATLSDKGNLIVGFFSTYMDRLNATHFEFKGSSLSFKFKENKLTWLMGIADDTVSGEMVITAGLHLFGFSYSASDDKLSVYLDEDVIETNTTSATLISKGDGSFKLELIGTPFDIKIDELFISPEDVISLDQYLAYLDSPLPWTEYLDVDTDLALVPKSGGRVIIDSGLVVLGDLTSEDPPVTVKGATGNTGATGDTGDPGAQGIQGIQGEQGDQGDQGEVGDNYWQGSDRTISTSAPTSGDGDNDDFWFRYDA